MMQYFNKSPTRAMRHAYPEFDLKDENFTVSTSYLSFYLKIF